MFIPPQRTYEELSRPAAEAFRFWISFWPTAPLFGVEWRFAEAARSLAPLPAGRPGKEVRAAAKAQKRTAQAIADAPAVAAPVAEEALKARPALVEPAIERTLEPEPKAEATPKPAANSEPKSHPTPDRKSDATSEAKLQPKSEPKPEPKSEPKSEAKPEQGAGRKSDRKAEQAAEPLPVVEPEVPTEVAAQRNLTLELEPGDGAPKRPKGLLKTPPKEVDDLKMIKGVGPGLESQLNGLGVYTYRQIANFTDQDLAWIDANLTSFKGRCFRDDWIGQAKELLAA